jgi:hypothetical protein
MGPLETKFMEMGRKRGTPDYDQYLDELETLYGDGSHRGSVKNALRALEAERGLPKPPQTRQMAQTAPPPIPSEQTVPPQIGWVNNMTPEEQRAQKLQLMQAKADVLRRTDLSEYNRMSAKGDFDILRKNLSPQHSDSEVLNNMGIVQYFRSPSSNAENQKQYDATTAARAKFQSDADAMLGQQPATIAASPQAASPQAAAIAAPPQAAPSGPQLDPVIPLAMEGTLVILPLDKAGLWSISRSTKI